MKKQYAKVFNKTLALFLAVALVISVIPGICAYAFEGVLEISVNENAVQDTETVTVPANTTVPVEAKAAAYFILSIEDQDITVTFSGKEYAPENGKIEVFLTKNQLSVPFDLTNHSGTDKEVTLTFTRYEGHKNNPFIWEGTQAIEFEQSIVYANIGNENGTFYEWEAPKSGDVTIELEILEAASDIIPYIIVDGITSVNGVLSLSVEKDQVVLMRLVGHPENNMLAPNAKLKAQITYEGGDTEPTEPVHECYVDQFVDVDVTRWYHDALDYMVSNGYMNGMSATTMEPNGNLTRAQWAKLLYEVEGAPSVAGMTHPFTDVPAGKWYTNAVIWAFNEGIVKGVSETSFGPNSNITREQMATMLYRYAGSPKAAGSLDAFRDGATVGSFAKDAMIWATQNGIINGVGNNYLEPKGNATRAQAAKILYEYMQ